MIWTKNYLCNIFFLWLIYLVLTDFALSFSFSRWSLRTLTRNSFLIFHSRETSSWKAWLLWEAAMDTTRQKLNCSRIGHIWHLMMLKVNLTRFAVFIYLIKGPGGPTPLKTPRISWLKSQILKPPFLSLMWKVKWWKVV